MEANEERGCAGISVAGRVPCVAPMSAESEPYIRAKAVKLGHQFDHIKEAHCA